MKWFHRKTPYSLYVTAMTQSWILKWCFMLFLSDQTPTSTGWVISVKCLCCPSPADLQAVRVVSPGGVHGCYSLKCHYRSKKDWLACEEMEVLLLLSFRTCNINVASWVVSTVIYLERWFLIARAKVKTEEGQKGGWDAGKQFSSSSDMLCPVMCLCWLCFWILVVKMPNGQFT